MTLHKALGRFGLACFALALLSQLASLPAAEKVLPGTAPLTVNQPLDELMVDGLDRFCLRELAASRDLRARQWGRDFSSPQDRAASVAGKRKRLQEMIGAVDLRLTAAPAHAHRFELVSSPDRPSVAARNRRVTVHRVRWPVLDGVTAAGLLLVPEIPRAGVVACPMPTGRRRCSAASVGICPNRCSSCGGWQRRAAWLLCQL